MWLANALTLSRIPIAVVFWLTYGQSQSEQRHSTMTQITPANATQLRPVWTFQTGVIPRRGFEGTPIVLKVRSRKH